MHNLKRRAIGSFMAVMMGTTTILGSTPTLASASYTYGDFVCGTQANATVENEQEASQVNAENNYGLVSVTQGNILHAWDWKFTDVTENIEDIAKAGYSVVQVSPCQVCEDASINNEWWKLYQPYDYKFGNVLGSEAQFKEMCATADKYGVSIVVDVVANHVAGTGEGSCGERKPQVDPWWTDDKFHNENVKFTGAFDENREMMVRSNIGMPDVATEREDVQQRMISYLETMLDMGADGFRYDAAKHIGTTSDTGRSQDTFWQNISAAVAKKRPDALVYGEILNKMPVTDEYYVKDGIKVTESQKGWQMKDALQKGGAAAAYVDNGKEVTFKDIAFTYTRKASDDKLITWVENHDTYLNYWGCTGLKGNANYMSDDQIMLGWSTVGARANAQALYFARPDGCSAPAKANPTNDDSNTIEGKLGISTKNFDWKDAKVAAVNKFKNAMIKEGETLSTSGNMAIIVRGNKGVVATNFGSGEADLNVSGLTGLKDGTYKDASGQNGTFTVSGGKVTGKVKGQSFVVLYDENDVAEPTVAPATTTPATVAPVTETPAEHAYIAMIKDKGIFDTVYEEQLGIENAEYAYYSNDGAEWTKVQNGITKIKIGEGAKNNGDTYALYVKAMGKDGQLVEGKKTYTYKTGSGTVGQTHKMKLRIPKADFATAPYVYFKGDAAWPGTAMTEEGNYWVYVSDTKDSGEVIFNNNGNWQDPERDKGWHSVSGYMEYSKTAQKVTAFTETVEATVSPDAKKANEAPEFKLPATETPAPATETPAPATETPAPATETPAPAGPITVSKEEGTAFTSETLEVEINVGKGVKGTYSVDNGPEIAFTEAAKAVLGQGKIADTDVTLTVKAGDLTKTFTYKKVFDKAVAAKEQASGMVAKGNAVMKIQSLFEVVADAAQVNAATNDTLAAQYGTNTVGVGTKKTITVDDSISDWTPDMLIAQGAANDDPRVYRPNSMYEVPIDEYALYGAYDDSNLYLMWEMTNVQDVVAPNDDFPLTQGTMYLNMNIPFFIAIDTGKDDVIGKNGALQTTGTIWGSGITIESKFNRLIAISTNGANGPYVYSGDATGLNPVEVYSKAGGGEAGAKKSGIQFGYGQGILSSKVVGIDGAYGANHNRVVGDVCNDSAAWVDYNTKGHNSAKMDYHYEIAIPFEELGITASDVASNGVGALVIATSGKSGMDCLPYDVSMNDQADKDDSVGSQENNSFEKSDEDNITTTFARIGKGDINPQRTVNPSTEAPATETPATETPATVAPATVAPATEAPVATTSASVTEAPVPTATPVQGDTKTMIVNFGADRSAPQLPGTALTLKAIGYNQTGAATYEFAVDDKVVQAASAQDTFAWTPEAGMHTIQVTMKDEAGKTVVVKKAYLIGDGSTVVTTTAPTTPATSTTPVESVLPSVTTGASIEPTATTGASIEPIATTGASVVPTATVPVQSDVPVTPAPTTDTGMTNPVITVNPEPTVAPTKAPGKLKVLLGFKKPSPQKLGTGITLVANVTGGKAKYKYTYVAELSNGFTKTIAKNTTKNTVTWKPTKTGTYKLTVTVTDATGKKASNSAKYKITAKTVKKKLAITKATVSKKTIKVKQKLKITASGTASKGTLKFKYVVRKSGQKKSSTIKSYSTKKTVYWTPKKTGKYYITIYATDSSKKVVKKTITVTVKKK